MSEPLVSILVASYNHEQFIEQALDSVLSQSHRNIELIIVDDCSTDGSVALIQRWIERTGQPTQFIVNEQNRGICTVLNQLFAQSSGEFCVFLDSDDWMEPNRISHHVTHFESLEPNVVVVFGDALLCGENGQPLGGTFLGTIFGDKVIPDGAEVFDRLLGGNFIPTAAVMVRRLAILDVGGYDESLSYDDYDMWLRLSHKYAFSYCDGVVANYRVLSSSMSHSTTRKPKMLMSTITIFERWASRNEVLLVPSRRIIVAGHLRRLAQRIAPFDAQRAHRALRTAEELVPSLRWRLIDRLRVFHLPGGTPLLRRLSRWAARRHETKMELTA